MAKFFLGYSKNGKHKFLSCPLVGTDLPGQVSGWRQNTFPLCPTRVQENRKKCFTERQINTKTTSFSPANHMGPHTQFFSTGSQMQLSRKGACLKRGNPIMFLYIVLAQEKTKVNQV